MAAFRGTAQIARACAVLALAGAALTGCGLTVPADPDGTLDRVSGGELRAGASPDGDLVKVDGTDVSGPLPDLVEAFADSLDADVVWTVGSEESLVVALEEGELDLAVGGMTDQTPWLDRVAVTRGFPDLPGVDGDRPTVMFAPLGENRFLGELERFLDDATAEASRG